MNPAEGSARRLARRLRSLRTEGYPGRRITQGELAAALNASVPLISSWESATNPKCPPRERLFAYATFFATERSLAQTPFRLLANPQLTSEEQARRDELFAELTGLRDEAQGREAVPRAGDPFADSHWCFPPGQDVTIVCSALYPPYLEAIPYADPKVPDYVELYKFADLDALLELYGHLRAVNPLTDIRVRTPAELKEGDYTSHLVLLGGVDWNQTTADLLYGLDVPVKQLGRKTAEPGGFLVGEGPNQQRFDPVLRKVEGDETLLEDVAHFFRGPSPLNDRRTITLCNGMYARGTYGAVRALTDPHVRERNDDYLRTRFAGKNTYSILSRVRVFLGRVVTPDWTSSDDLLHEWPVPAM